MAPQLRRPVSGFIFGFIFRYVACKCPCCFGFCLSSVSTGQLEAPSDSSSPLRAPFSGTPGSGQTARYVKPPILMACCILNGAFLQL